MKTLVTMGLVLALATVAARAEEPAPDSDAAHKERARRHYKSGMAAYTLEQWDEAIREFQAGFKEEPNAVFLYNLGQAYRLSRRPTEALSYYQKYLRLAPDAPNRAEVEERITTLQRLLQESGRPPETTVAPGETTSPAGAPTTHAPAASTSGGTSAAPPATPVDLSAKDPAASSSSAATVTAAAPAPRRRWAVWVGIAAGVVVVAAAIVLGVTLGSSTESSILGSAR